jgi:hypothetical protein
MINPSFAIWGNFDCVFSDQFPFQVSIFKLSDMKNHCGGSLIGPSHVLTAAHCFEKESFKDLTVKVIILHHLLVWIGKGSNCSFVVKPVRNIIILNYFHLQSQRQSSLASL